MRIIRLLALACALLLPESRAAAQGFNMGRFLDTAMTRDEYIRRHLARFITPEYVKRVDRMRLIQRTGYASVLTEVVRHDAFAAVVDYLRMRLHLDYSQNFGPVYYPSQTTTWFELPIDRSFPVDPWEREPWRR